jgi:signal transduction histidine kinase
LFQEFAKLSARPTGGEKSTGLGLAITRRIIQGHGGTIDVDSIPGQGATFWFSIPDPRE